MNDWDEIQKAIETFGKAKQEIPEVVLTARVKDCVLNATGRFSRSSIASWLDIRGDAKLRAASILREMQGEGIIAPVGSKDGDYRLVDRNPHIMDLTAPEIKRANIELPFLLHDLVMLYPKNIILVSGEKDAGKTAFAMNVAYMNRDAWRVRYFNSEMGLDELRGRLKKFNYPMGEWQKIAWYEQAKQFEDHIDPNGLNIIDFLEVGAEAYTVTEDIRRVFDKLDQGLLLIVMQKRSYKEYAVGGEGTLEKARLAVNLEHKDGKNLCRITVAKNWTSMDNPKWKVCEYKVHSGGVMNMDKYWEHPDKTETPAAREGFTPKKKSKAYNLGKADPDFPAEE